MASSNPHHAVVLTGSGANAAYEVGVLRALLAGPWGLACAQRGAPANPNSPIDPYCYAGTSIGAVNAAVMVAQTTDRAATHAVDFLERLWLEEMAGDGTRNGVFRLRADPTRYWWPQEYASRPLDAAVELGRDLALTWLGFGRRAGHAISAAETPHDAALALIDFSLFCDVSPLRALMQRTIDFGKIKLASRQLRIGATNWERGRPHTFTNEDMDGGDGVDAIVGAVSIPGMMTPQLVNGYFYLDGSVLAGSPLTAAIVARPPEATGIVIHVVYLDTDKAVFPEGGRSTFEIVYRLFLLALSQSVGADLRRVDALNERIRMRDLFAAVADLSGSGDRFVAITESLKSAEAALFWEKLTRDTAGKVPVTVHRHSPTRHVHEFNFRQVYRDRIESLMRAGYEDTVAHDCEKSGCVLTRV